MVPGRRTVGRMASVLLRMALSTTPAVDRDRREMELAAQLAAFSRARRAAVIGRLVLGSAVVTREQSELRRTGVGFSWRCTLGGHVWHRLADDDRESDRSMLLECDRCGHRRDVADPDLPRDRYLSWGPF